MRVYLDLCVIQRPLDTPNQVRIVLESEAVLGIIALCHKGQLELLSSEVLFYEGEQNPLPIRREHTFAVLSEAKSVMMVMENEKKRAANLMTYGIKPLDALHLALAETGRADYFCTCDDRLLRSAGEVKDLLVKVVNPVDFNSGDGKMITVTRPLVEINLQAIHLLYKELGIVDAVRFLSQFTQGYGNYTQERDALFTNKSLDEIVNEIEERRKPG